MTPNTPAAAVIPPCARASRGYHLVYRRDTVNHCPGCGHTHWLIGRLSAECGFCATALPLAEAVATSHPMPVLRRKQRDLSAAWAA